MSHHPIRLLVILAAALAVAPQALAYLDPASGSMILQLLLGGIAGAALAIKIYWRKLLGFFGVERKDESEAEDDAGETDDPPV